MNPSEDLRGELVAAIQIATHDVSHLTRFPTDNAAIMQIQRVGTTICSIARTLAIPELADLGRTMVEGVKGDLSQAEEINNLRNTISRMSSIAKTVELNNPDAIP